MEAEKGAIGNKSLSSLLVVRVVVINPSHRITDRSAYAGDNLRIREEFLKKS